MKNEEECHCVWSLFCCWCWWATSLWKDI